MGKDEISPSFSLHSFSLVISELQEHGQDGGAQKLILGVRAQGSALPSQRGQLQVWEMEKALIQSLRFPPHQLSPHKFVFSQLKSHREKIPWCSWNLLGEFGNRELQLSWETSLEFWDNQSKRGPRNLGSPHV